MKMLKNIEFKEMLHAWSMSVVLSQQRLPYKSKYPLVAINTLLSQDGERITIDDSKYYKQLNLKYYGGGVTVRNNRAVSGKDIKTRSQTVVGEGQFLFSKIDARHGAFGVVPKEMDGAIVSSEFPVFTVNENKVMAEFLSLVMSSVEMVKYIKHLSQGSTNRKRLDMATFLSIKVPLPAIQEQQRMMTGYFVSQQKVSDMEKEQEELPCKIQLEIASKTATTVNKKVERQILSVTSFESLVNWGVDSVLESMKVKSAYPLVKIGECVQTFLKDAEGGTLRVSPKKNPTKEYQYIGMDAIEKYTGRMMGYEYKRGAEIKSNAYVVPCGYFIYGRLRPNLNKYWVNTHLEEKEIVCSTEFFVFSLNSNVNRDYFECILGSDIVQEQIRKYITGTGLPRISATDFLNILIPNPPEDVKSQLGVYFKDKQHMLWDGQRQIAIERAKAKMEFESQIFEHQ